MLSRYIKTMNFEKVDGILLEFRLEKGDVGGHIVRRVTLLAHGVFAVLKRGHSKAPSQPR
jgi:hypothetical protein